MPKTLKIKFYQDGITDPFFHSVRLSISTSPALFTTFDQVKDHYTSFKRTASALDNPGTTQRGILSFGRGGPGRGRGDGKRHRQGGDSPRKPTQEEIDACTHIKAKRYDSANYKMLNPAEKAKHWQLLNPLKQAKGVDRGRGGKPAYDRRKDTIATRSHPLYLKPPPNGSSTRMIRTKTICSNKKLTTKCLSRIAITKP